MEVQKIKIKSDYKLADIIHDIQKGILRIPQFQREFVWDKPKVVKLLDSIYKEYPIGSFFFWAAPPKYKNFYRDVAELNLPKPDKYDNITFILDGQQRITSLYVAIQGLTLYERDYHQICFDLDTQSFIDRKPDNQRYISICDLLADSIPDLYDNLTPERKISFKDCYRRFVNYPFSAIEVHDKDLDEVCDIFERINQGGQRLNLFDLVVASTWSTDFDLRIEVDNQNEIFKNKGFGELENEVYIQALSLIAKGSCTRPAQLQMTSQDIQEFWKPTLDAIVLAVDFLRKYFGVVNAEFIPYPSMVAMVAYLFYKVKHKSLSHDQAELLSKWFWQTAFSERYSASTLTLMTEDRRIMDKISMGTPVDIKYSFEIDIDSLIKIRMYRKSAIKNGVLCLLAMRKPRHFKNNVELDLSDSFYSDFNNSERHHIFPKAIVQKKYSQVMVHSLPNFCFIPAELNKEISDEKPSLYFEKFNKENPEFKDTLKTHVLKYDDSIIKNDYLSFLGSRAAAILEEITAITGSRFSKVIIDNVSSAILKTEESLRDFFDNKLYEKSQFYWKELVPSHIYGNMKERVNKDLEGNPAKQFSDLSPRQLFDYCDIMDYPQLILHQWGIFGKYFRSKYEVDKRFVNLNEYRRAIMHSRGEITPIIKKEGEAALEWLYAILKDQKSERKESKKETDEETISRVKNDFVRRAVKSIPEWVEKEFSGKNISIVRGAGSFRSIKQGNELILFYYYANNWIFAVLELTTPEETQMLEKQLSNPVSIIQRNNKWKEVRFHVVTENDLKLLQKIIEQRIK